MELLGKIILVTGGAGLIGSKIIDQLLAEGVAKILVVDNFTRGTELNLEGALASGRVSLVREDIRNYSAIAPLFVGIDAVFHQAAIRITLCADQPRECMEVLYQGTFNVLQACVESKVKKIVRTQPILLVK